MIRKIVNIDEKKCTGCGLCVNACHEGALRMINGKARLISESYCDGLGDCLPECPAGAITIEEREAQLYDEKAVKNSLDKSKFNETNLSCGCPGTSAKLIARKKAQKVQSEHISCNGDIQSELRQWPCQIKLVSTSAPYLDNANLLIAADCTAFAYANIHREFMKNKITLIGCTKLDNVDYSEKIAAILIQHEIKSITVLKMEVPCCAGLANAVKAALIKSKKMIPWRVVTVSTDGNIIED